MPKRLRHCCFKSRISAFGKAASRAGTSCFGMAGTMIAGGLGSPRAVRFMRFPFSWGSHNGAGGPESVGECLRYPPGLALLARQRGCGAAADRGRGCRRPRGGALAGGDSHVAGASRLRVDFLPCNYVNRAGFFSRPRSARLRLPCPAPPAQRWSRIS